MLRAICILACAVLLAAEDGWRWDHQPGMSVALRRGDQELWIFHYAPAEHTPWFHPVTTTAGLVVSDMAPADHRWHRGLWFSWKFIDQVNYWEMPWQGLTTAEGPATVEVREGTAVITLAIRYHQGERTVLTERRIITAQVPQADGSYTLDWDMTFTPVAAGVTLDRTPLPGEPGGKSWGGYAGLSFRSWRAATAPVWTGSEGRSGKALHGQGARWSDMTVTAADGRQGGVAIFDHPGNPRHPGPWFIGDAGLPYLGAAPLFQQPLTLAAGTTLRLRYRVLVHPGVAEPQALERAWSTYVGR